jgi:sugar O-acyltransferase (sialic acid O-acetyltransferase NeuD family)
MVKKNIIVIGAGGHAKVVLATLSALKQNIAGLVDDNPNLIGSSILGHKVVGDISFLHSIPNLAVICAIGDNKLRHAITTSFSNLHWITAIHPSAYVHESVLLGKGTVVFAGAVIQPETVLGDHVIVNTTASIDHDCRIKSFAHIAPGSRLGGGVHIGAGTLIGIGTSIKPCVSVGEWSVVGVGSVIVKDIKGYAYAKGAPAKVYKEII